MLTDHEIIVAQGTIAIFGIGSQWIARYFGFPALLLLLPAGVAAGDLGLVDSEALLGDTLFPLATLLVALLLFQSGLELSFAELPSAARGPVYRLITIGLVITFLGSSLAALAFLDIDTNLAFLVGAIIVVSGPTVVGPLLSTMNVRDPTSSVLNFEGSFLDPIGATLGVVVLNLILAADRGGVHPVLQGLSRLGLGIIIGLVLAVVFIFILSRFWVTDNMEAALAIMFAIGAFMVADILLSEAGLFAALTFGVLLANQRIVSIRRVTGFGKSLEVLIIGTLFILLGALVSVDQLADHGWAIALLVAALVLIVRPLSAFFSLLGTRLRWRDRAMIGWVDPRGIVAASTAAAFTGSLAAANIESDFLLPVVFGVILGTGVIYGITAKPVARRLGVTLPPSSGIGLVGNDPWVLDLARQLQDADVGVLVAVLKRPEDARRDAQEYGVPVVSTVQNREVLNQTVNNANLAQVVVCTPPEVSIAESQVIDRFGRRNVLRLPGSEANLSLDRHLPKMMSARPFAQGVTYDDIENKVAEGAVIQVIDTSADADALALAAVRPDGTVNLQPGTHSPEPGDIIIGLVGAPTGNAS